MDNPRKRDSKSSLPDTKNAISPITHSNTMVTISEPASYYDEKHTPPPRPGPTPVVPISERKSSDGSNCNNQAQHKTKVFKTELWTFWVTFLGTIAMGVALSYGLLGPIYATKPFEETLPAGYGSGIYLLGVVDTLDLGSRIIGIQWLIHSCIETGPYSGCNALLDQTNFFTDGQATPTSPLVPETAALVYKPNLQGYITDGFCIGDSDCWHDQVKRGVPFEQTLYTQHRFSTRPAAWNWRSNAQAYPFDTYDVYTTFLALDPATNASRTILGASLTGTIPNFGVGISSRAVSDGVSPFTWRRITMQVHRSEVVMGFAFLIWGINWLMTGVVLWITISAVQGRRKIPADLFGIPITALFALPTVRQSMPGSPEFGSILDYSGIILNLALLAICSVALLLSVIARDAKEIYSPLHRHAQLLPEQGSRSFFGRFSFRRRATDNTLYHEDTMKNGETNGLGLKHV